MNDFLNNPRAKLFHTSGYAQVAHGQSLGAGSPETFNQRRLVNRNRQSVGQYHQSMVAYHPRRADTEHGKIDIVRPFSDQANRQIAARRYGPNAQRPSGDMRPQQRSGFVEPPPRYNPYA